MAALQDRPKSVPIKRWVFCDERESHATTRVASAGCGCASGARVNMDTLSGVDWALIISGVGTVMGFLRWWVPRQRKKQISFWPSLP